MATFFYRYKNCIFSLNELISYNKPSLYAA